MSSVKEEFNDPALKEAVCKCWACDCAPAHLKDKISNLLTSRENSRSTSNRLSWMIWPTSIAALLIISVGLFEHFRPAAQPAFATIPPLSPTLITDLITTHDHCCSTANHQHLKVPKSDDVAIADALRTQLHQPILVCRPADDAWLFRGAAVCPVGSTPSGHLVFAKGDQRLSLFSLPKTLTSGASDGTEYSSTTNQHCIVAFVKDGGLFCLVESGPAGSVNVDELKQMESQMQPAVTMGRTPRGTQVELAQLLQPIAP